MTKLQDQFTNDMIEKEREMREEYETKMKDIQFRRGEYHFILLNVATYGFLFGFIIAQGLYSG